MKHPLFSTCLAILLLGSSCNKPQALANERAGVEAEIRRLNEEMRGIDAKFETLRNTPMLYGMTYEQQQQEAANQNITLEAQLSYLSKKCAAGEATVSELRPRVDAYKARHLR